MAGFTERISVLIDVTSNKAVSGLKDFQKSVADAQGFTGKLKAGVGSLKDTFTAAAASPAALGAAAAAAGTFALKAADEFSQLGVSIGKFADATGVATEDASRWVEVAGDIGISSDTLTGVFNKLNKSIDPKVFKDLGVEIARTSSGNVNASETFLNVIDRLNGMTDPAQRAQAASKLLGKGWTDVAELVGMSAQDIRKQLAAVGDEKVFDQSEVKQAREYRAAMDNLNDAFEKVVIVLGEELAPALSDISNLLADTLGVVGDVKDALGPLGDSGLQAFNKIRDGVAGWWDDLWGNGDEIEYTGEAVTHLGDAAAQSQRYLGLLAEHTRESADSAADLTGKARLARAELKLLQDQIDGRKSFIDLQIALRNNAERLQQLADDYKAGKITAEQYYQDVASASLDAQGSLADYVATVDEIPDTVKTDIVAEFDPLNPQKAWQAIQSYFDSHAIQVTTETGRETRRLTGGISTPVSGGTGGLSGIRTPGQAESIGSFSRGTSVTVNVNGIVTNPTETGRQIADALRAYYRNGGEPV
jgi:hypothetical protein